MNIQFDHIAITSENISDSLAFYKHHFPEAVILYEDKTWGFLKIGDLKLALVTPGEHPPHICYRVDSKEELQKYAEESRGEIKIHRDKSESFYLSDPSGNAIEIIWYPEN
jgi:catechol 2,3-dioxygenase-like lactoylglutathione lyase family enzyme